VKKAVKPKLMSESDFQKAILNAFKDDDNIKMFRRNVGAARTVQSNGKKGFIRFAEAGQSDLWGWIVQYMCPFCNRKCEGTHFEIELKSADGKLTPAQEDWLVMVAESNGIALVLRPIESDPVGLRQRVCTLLERRLCPKCYEQSKMVN